MFFPNLNKFDTCYEVKFKTFFVVFFANFIFSRVSSDNSVFYSAGSTFFEISPPTDSNPFDSHFPVKANPFPIPFDAPIRTLFALI